MHVSLMTFSGIWGKAAQNDGGGLRGIATIYIEMAALQAKVQEEEEEEEKWK